MQIRPLYIYIKNFFLFFLFFSICRTSNGQVNLNQGLIAFYPFNGNANDFSGNGNHGTLMNGVQPTTDRFGNPNSAYFFDGMDDYISVPNSPILNPPNAMSIALYFYPTRTGIQILLGKVAYTGAVSTQYQITMNDPSYPGVKFGVNSAASGCAGTPVNTGSVNTNIPIDLDTWHCIVGTFDNGVQKIYLNGVLMQTINTGFTTLNSCSNATIQIGKWWSADPFQFQGKIDDVRIYNRALNQEEVSALCLQEVIVNKYTPVIAFNQCYNSVTVESTSEFGVGDTILLAQMKGAIIDSANNLSYGNIADYRNAGNYEFNYIKAINGNSIELLNSLERNYDWDTGRVQLIRVPYYQNLTVTDKLTCLPWDGSKGGVLAVIVENDLTFSGAGEIDVSGRGFRGATPLNSSIVTCNMQGYVYTQASNNGGRKGEGVYNVANNNNFGRGSPANAGGGGNAHNAGGGGGSNAGAGGHGGNQWNGCATIAENVGGKGGKELVNNATLNKLFFGGGGGMGHGNDQNEYPAGHGGGIIIIQASSINSNGNSIRANGTGGQVCPGPSVCNDGLSGGGAGGSILLNVPIINGNTVVEAKGGAGANSEYIHPVFTTYKVGPGGGGGGGFIALTQPAVSPDLLVNTDGGVNGILLLHSNDPYGATSGQNGTVLTSFDMFFDTNLFTPNIDSVRIRETATSCSSFDFEGVAYINTAAVNTWYWDFGDGNSSADQNTFHTYNNSGTYDVKLVVTDINGCKDSIIIQVSPTVLNLDFSYNIDVCDPQSVQFTGSGNTAPGIFWDFGDGNNATGIAAPIHNYATTGTYIVKYALTNGPCSDTITKSIFIGVLPGDIILTPDTTICFGTSLQLRTVPSLSFCWSPATYLDDPLSPQPVSSTPGNITYYLTAELMGNNLVINGDFSQGNTGFTSGYQFAGTNVTEGQYFVGSNPQAWNGSMASCGDHTGGNGNMMLVNGSPVADVEVWRQTITVTPNTNYAFSTWIQALWAANPAQLQFSINGLLLGGTITASLPVCNWTQFYTSWNSGNAATAVISIVNKNTTVAGNDFALDDISFAPLFIQRDSVRINVDTAFVSISNNDTTICAGASVQLTSSGAFQYSWFPSSSLSDPLTSNPVASPVTSTEYIVTGLTMNGCAAFDTVMVNLYALPAITISNDTAICQNSSVQLFASGGVSYNWSPAATLNDPQLSNPFATPVTPTRYYVQITDGNNCQFQDSVLVEFRPPPVFSISPVAQTCQGNQVQLLASGGDIYAWQPSGTLSNSSISNPIAFPAASTTYTVTITESTCNESATLSTDVTILPSPQVQAFKSNDIDCSNDRSQLTATGAVQYNWSPAATLNNPSIPNPLAMPVAATQYTVTGTDANGCSGTSSITVSVENINQGGYHMPTAFTPNNDGLNDCYGIKFWGIVEEIEFSIYNRWGERVFHTKNRGQCWNGIYKGVPQDAGVYVYMIRAKTSCDPNVFRKGTFVLIR